MLLVKPLQQSRRRGAVLPMVTICLIALVGCVALAVDIGLIGDARAELQDHVDAAVLAAVRQLDGVTTASTIKTAAEDAARDTVKVNRMFGKLLNEADLGAGGNVKNLQIGVYRYDASPGVQKFNTFFVPPNTGENYGAATMELQMDQPLFFARIFGFTKQTVSAKATAVHRPRDIAIILDFSGSMCFGSRNSLKIGDTSGMYDTGSNFPRSSHNADPNFPRVGPWSVFPQGTVASPMVTLGPRSDSTTTFAPSNLTFATLNGPPIVYDFTTKVGSDYDKKAWAWGIDPPDPQTDPPTLPTHPAIATYDPLSLTNPTVMPAPIELSNQFHADWPLLSKFGDKFPLRRAATMALANLDGNPADFAANAREYVNFMITNHSSLPASDTRKFTTLGAWSDGGTATKASVDDSDRHTGWENHGYGPDFKGYTMGPAYYGKTFYMWPPDPRTPNTGNPPGQGKASNTDGEPFYQWGDWRKRFFFNNGTTTQINGTINNKLWNDDPDGVWRTGGRHPNGTAVGTFYDINYNAVMQWIKSGPRVFPDSLRCGRMLYYDDLANTTLPNSKSGVTANQRFWMEYIDFVIGAGHYPRTDYLYGVNTSNTFGGNTYGSGTDPIRIDSNSSNTYMRYDDIPIHPRAHMWFGPMTMVDFMSQYTGAFAVGGNGVTSGGVGMMPGACREAQTWQLKAGVQSALDDIEKNHPNDLTTLIHFSTISQYNMPRHALSNKYGDVKKMLWFPYTIDNGGTARSPSYYLAPGRESIELRAFTNSADGWGHVSGGIVPRADGGTAPDQGFKVAYNQFSSHASAPSQGGNGRIGANKLVIFETDGVPNRNSGGTITPNGANLSYYGTNANIGTTTSTNDEAAGAAGVIAVVNDMRNTTNGFGVRCKVHCIGFGDLLEPGAVGRANALTFLNNVQAAGGTPTPLQTVSPEKVVIGNYIDRIELIKKAFRNIMQSDVQLSLIE